MSNFTFVPVPANWRDLPRHEFSAEMGDMTEAEFVALCNDMQEHGYQGRPVLLVGNKTFEVADGWHQLNAAAKAGVVPSFERYIGKDLFGEVWRRHGPRKHWTSSQRAMIAARVANRQKGGESGIGKTHQSAEMRIGPTQESAAKTLNVSERSVQNAAKVIADGTPALQAAVMDGTVAVTDAAAVADEPAKVQDAAVKKVRKGKAKTVKDAVSPSDADETVITDAVGHVVPEAARAAFVADFAKAVSFAQQLQALVSTLAAGPGGEQLARFTSPKRSGKSVIHHHGGLDELKGNLKGTRPHAVCPYCVTGNTGHRDRCHGCDGRGWVTKTTWDGATDAEKGRLAS